MAFQLNSKPLATDVAFKTSDGTQYPANWLRLASADEKKKIGITEVADEAAYDQRFYWGVGNAKELVDKTEKIDGKDVTTKGLKTNCVDQQKETAGSLLAPSDWYVTRKAEKGTAIPSDITTYRDSLRTICKTREDEINACSDVAALKKLIDGTYDKDGKRTAGITLWPVDPNAETP